MIGLICRRFFHSSQVNRNMASSALGKLRKSTGFSISNCKKALELFPHDILMAEEWLYSEAKKKGWSKWSKIQNRSATQGLIGVFSNNKYGVMVEVNCETDFVARNSEFQLFVENVLLGCLHHASNFQVAQDLVKRTTLDETQIHAIKYESSTLEELVTSAISKFNEKMVTKRAVCFNIGSDLCLSSLSHPRFLCPNLKNGILGRYGALLAYKKTKQTDDDIEELGPNICQHIIGMNPLSLGEFTEKDMQLINQTPKNLMGEENKNTSEDVSQSSDDISNEETEGQDELATDLRETNETRLLFQPFLLDTSTTVGETLLKSGLEIIDYERFECGETESVHNEKVAEAISA